MSATALGRATTGEGRQWSPDALSLLNFVYGFWAQERRPPTFLDIHREFGVTPRRTRRLFRELHEGFGLTSKDQLIGLSIEKAPPFSATPTTVAAYTDDRFLSYLGCPMEGLTIGALPPLEQKIITLRSWCACCYAPIELKVQGQQVLDATPASPIISVIRSPYDWEGGVSPEVVCDSYHYVLDQTHHARFERQTLRQGTTMTLDQARQLTADTASRRMKDPHIPQIRIEAEPMIAFLAKIGVDTTVWQAG